MEFLFEPYHHHSLKLKNRIIRSAVYEGRCDADGFPGGDYVDFYEELANGGVGGIITGFAFVSKEGRAMQPRQAGMDQPQKIPFFRKMTEAVHRHDCPVFLQISHAGRQSLASVTGSSLRGVSSGKSIYFRQKTIPFSTAEIYERIDQYANSALYAKEAGFDGIQLHAAHGYLIHQFLLEGVNKRKDEFGFRNGTGPGTAFLEKIILSVREKCGHDFPVLVKISGAVDIHPRFEMEQFESLVRFLDRMQVAAIEISYGTMDHALNIFRGDMPKALILSKNPIMNSRKGIGKMFSKIIINQYFERKLKPFTPHYNLEFAAFAKKLTGIPIISVGGFRSGDEIRDAISSGKTDLAGLARPLICEPDFIQKMKMNGAVQSRCLNCNYCAVMCDTDYETRCYKY